VLLAETDLSTGIDARDNFKLTGSYLYNTKTTGPVVPNTTAAWFDYANGKALKATLPVAPGNHRGPLAYTTMTTPDIALGNTIYTPEAKGVASSNDAPDATCLVVGGLYQQDTQPSYYRLDFLDKSNNYRDILRNHLYKVHIIKVHARGYATEDEAFRAKPVNMTAEVLDWNQGDMGDVIFDGQYMLSVNQGEFEFSSDARTAADKDNQLLIFTDYPKGWNIDPLITDAPGGTNAVAWLSVNVNAGTNPGGAKDRVALLTGENTSGSDRIAYLTIQAGRLNYRVKVTQTTQSKTAIEIIDKNGNPVSELLFFSDPGIRPDEQSFTVRWTPKSNPLMVTLAPYNNKQLFDFSNDNGYESVVPGQLTNPFGEKTCSIRPLRFTTAELAANPFCEKVSEFTYSLTNHGETKTKTIFIRQINYNIAYAADPYYLMDGQNDHYFTIRSNIPWRATLIDNNGANANVLVGLITTQGAGNSTVTGEKVFFQTVNDQGMKIVSGLATVHIEPVIPGTFLPFDVPLYCVSTPPFGSNSYLVTPSGLPLEINVNHVSRAMGNKPALLADPGFLGNEWLSNAKFGNGNYKVQVLWSDVNSFGTTTSVVQSAVLSGTGFHNAKITVIPGAASGNALIILYEEVGGTPGYQSAGGDMIKWSWHIWSTPDKTAIEAGAASATWMMDRNLGAMSSAASATVATDRLATGLYYQWGRKDPFPAMNNSYSYQRKVYYSPGIEAADKYNVASNGAPGLASATNRPLNFLNRDDWYDSGVTNDDLWGDGAGTAPSYVNTTTHKSVYDPCPEGWKVPDVDIWKTASANKTLVSGKIYLFGSYFPFNYDTRSPITKAPITKAPPGGGGPAGGGGDQGGGGPGYSTYGGWYWTATPDAVNKSKRLGVEYSTNGSSTAYTDAKLTRGYAGGIRCIRE
jgi:hypothetical protein